MLAPIKKSVKHTLIILKKKPATWQASFLLCIFYQSQKTRRRNSVSSALFGFGSRFASLSPHRFVASSPHRLIASSPHRLIAPSLRRLIASSPHRLIASSLRRFVAVIF